MPANDTWEPEQYERFRAERRAPFVDLLGMVERDAQLSAIDLGCGTGALTAELHDALGAESTLGIERSPAMLGQCGAHRRAGLRFEPGDIARLAPDRRFDLVFSNAALHWVADHPELLRRLTAVVRPGGQLAVQVPANHDQPSHTTAAGTARSEPFRSELGGFVSPVHVLAPEEYARLLHGLGYERQRVELRVYGHLLEEPRQVVEWVKGTTLTAYKERLSERSYARFLEEYERRLVSELPDERPFFFPFKRILFWARLPR